MQETGRGGTYYCQQNHPPNTTTAVVVAIVHSLLFKRPRYHSRLGRVAQSSSKEEPALPVS